MNNPTVDKWLIQLNTHPVDLNDIRFVLKDLILELEALGVLREHINDH